MGTRLSHLGRTLSVTFSLLGGSNILTVVAFRSLRSEVIGLHFGRCYANYAYPPSYPIYIYKGAPHKRLLAGGPVRPSGGRLRVGPEDEDTGLEMVVGGWKGRAAFVGGVGCCGSDLTCSFRVFTRGPGEGPRPGSGVIMVPGTTGGTGTGHRTTTHHLSPTISVVLVTIITISTVYFGLTVHLGVGRIGSRVGSIGTTVSRLSDRGAILRIRLRHEVSCTGLRLRTVRLNVGGPSGSSIICVGMGSRGITGDNSNALLGTRWWVSYGAWCARGKCRD